MNVSSSMRRRTIESAPTRSMDEMLQEMLEATGQCDFATASRIVRALQTLVVGTPLHQGLEELNNFLQAEDMYYSLEYVKTKLFRKDQMNILYHRSSEEFEKLIELCGTVTLPASVNVPLLKELLRQTCTLIYARRFVAETYRNIATSPFTLDTEATIQQLSAMFNEFRGMFTHAFFATIKIAFLTELSALLALFMASRALQLYNFKDASFYLYKSKIDLDTWKGKVFHIEPGKTTEPIRLPQNLQWLEELHSSLSAKFGLYFHRLLLKYDQEMGQLDQKQASGSSSSSSSSSSARGDNDYFAAIKAFQKRSDAVNVSLVYECTNLDPSVPFSLEGYQMSAANDRPTGVNSFPALFSYPGPPPMMEHWPNIIGLILSQRAALTRAMPDPFNFFDKRAKATYFLSRVDPNVLLAVIFSGQKVADRHLLEFLRSLSTSLRISSVYEKLNTGGKSSS